MSSLSLFWRCSPSCANGPNRLVSDDYLVPVGDYLSNGSQLFCVDFICFSSFSFGERLADAKYHGDASFERFAALLCHVLVGLVVQASSLGVAHEGVLDTEIDNLLDGQLAGVGAHSGERDILRCDADFVIEDLFDGREMQVCRCNDNIYGLILVFKVVQNVLGELLRES